jgi:hypothetical protein
MSPTKKARPVSPAGAKRKPVATSHEREPTPRDLGSPIVGGIALLVAGIALILAIRGRK